jgi:hypothetical protein
LGYDGRDAAGYVDADRQRLALPGRRDKSHPTGSIRVYQGHVAALLRDTGDGV